MDVVSELLKTVKLEGALFFNAEFSAPWCSLSPNSSEMTTVLAPAGGRMIIYHLLTEGRAWVKLPGGKETQLGAGDIVVFPHGDAHIIGNGPPQRPVDSRRLFSGNFTGELKPVRFGGGGEITRFVCGFMNCKPKLSDVFLAGLPKMFKVHVAGDPSGQWIQNSIRFSVDQVNRSLAGSGLILAKLSELLFMETLRRYVAEIPPDGKGWLAGARDSVTGQALALMHREPGESWTVATLAKRVGVSRTRLAERFVHFMGESPMAYLAQWRLTLAAEMLLSSDESITEVAAAAGYSSEAAFNRAFKRLYALPPAQFRRSRKEAARNGGAPPGTHAAPFGAVKN